VTEKGLSKMGYSGISSGPAPVGGATGQQQLSNQPVAGHATAVDPVTGTETYAATNNGPHASNIANKLDPRVRDGEPNPAVAGGTTTSGAVDPVDYNRRPDVATADQCATTEASHHKNPLNPSAINFKFWKKDKGDTEKVDNTPVGVNKNANYQDNVASTNYDGRAAASGVTGGNTVHENRVPANYGTYETNPNNELAHGNTTTTAPYTDNTQTQHKYQQPVLLPRTAANDTAEYPDGSTTTTKPGTSKFAQKLGASTGTGTRTDDPPVANMD
jgi:hypothetical protein